jgi:hypothetical protein
MTKPKGKSKDWLKELVTVKMQFRKTEFDKIVYPQSQFDTAIEDEDFPKCIFVPEKKLMRSMIKAVVSKP